MEVRRRPAFPGVQKTLGVVVAALASGLFLAGGLGTPASAYGILFITVGLIGLAYCVAMILLAAGTTFSARPALILDETGIRVLRPWPLPAGERLLPWSELGAVCAWPQGPPTGGRGAAATSQLYLSFLPARPKDAPHEVESGAELLATKVVDLPCTPTLRYTLRVRPTWDTTIDQIIQEVSGHTQDVPFADHRDKPKPKRPRRPAPR